MAEEKKPVGGLMDELATLGRQLSTAVKALWESEDSRRLRQEIGDGFMELGQQLDSAIKSAQDSEVTRQFSDQVKATVDKARESDVAGQVEDGLVTGLKELNRAIANLVSSLEPHAKGGEPAPDNATTPPGESPDA